MARVDVADIQKKARGALSKAQSLKELDGAYRAFLGKKGELTLFLRSLKDLPPQERKVAGGKANTLKAELERLFAQRKSALQAPGSKPQGPQALDITAPGKRASRGHPHPLTIVQRHMAGIFREMGFGVAEGPEIESEWYNFDALNIPGDHPARDMWDTFWLKPRSAGLLLRTHTSPVQVRYMQQHNPPFRIIAPGKVFRFEATDARHGFELYQLEGLVVGKDVSIANFRAVILEFYKRFFDAEVTVRLRPSYFPFVEPGFEVDMSCVFCDQKGCSTCGQAGWLEMMGAGMVHPNVFKAAGYVPKNWQGFAFGMGVDRLTMMKYRIPDIRLLYSGDMRVLEQF